VSSPGKPTADAIFDRIIDRRSSDSMKWNAYDADVLPMWVADMDFAVPEAVVRALRRRIEHGVFGYGVHPHALAEAAARRLARMYGWSVPADAVTFLPGVVPGFNLAVRVLARPGARLLVQTPVYPPILKAAGNAGLGMEVNRLIWRPDQRYEIDFSDFEAAADREVCAFLLCNPHNPVGRVFRTEELARMAEVCLSRGIGIISDEIHCDLVYRGYSHRPIASLDPEIGRRTITLMAATKTFNIAGLEGAFAVIPDPELRRRFEKARAGLVQGINLLGAAAALAAFEEGGPWLEALLRYLEANRNRVLEFVRERLPALRMPEPEGTYLAWIDCRGAGLGDRPAQVLLERGRLALNEGESFGPGGEGFVRLNFACPRSLLEEGLRRFISVTGYSTPKLQAR